MAKFLTRALGFVDVEEDDKYITIGGVKAENLGKDIMRLWGTNRIERYMFTEIGGRVIKFPKFFGPEVHYMLGKVLNIKNPATSRGSVKDALQLLEQNTWMKRITQEYPSIINTKALKLFRLSPMPHQVNFFNAYDVRKQQYALNGYLLSAGAGTGKTMMSLMLEEMLMTDVKVIVCPKNAVYRVWAGHFKEHYVEQPDVWIVADGEPYKRQKYVICHYEGLDKLKQAASGMGSGKVGVVLDESHNLNNDESLRTQLFIDICRMLRSENVLWMSGTPVKALGFESIPLLRCIDPLFTEEVEARFKKIYGRDASKALDILRQRIGMISFNVESSAVVTNKTHDHTQMVKIPNGKNYTLESVRIEMQKFIGDRLKYYNNERKSYQKTYDQALDIYEKTIAGGMFSRDSDEKKAFRRYKQYVEMISAGFDPQAMAAEAKYCNHFEKNIIAPTLPKDLKKAFMGAKSVIKYPQLKVLGEALGGVLGKKRVQCHLDMIPHMGMEKMIDSASKKTIIFSSYVEVVDAIYDYLGNKGYKALKVHAQSGEDLTSQVNKFFKDEKITVLVATFQSLSTAVPIIIANNTLFTNQPFREYEITQARARTNRLGQDTDVTYWNIFLDTGKEPNVSTRSRDILEWSRQQVAAILGKDYGGTITAEMVNAMESMEQDYTPAEIGIALEEYHDY